MSSSPGLSLESSKIYCLDEADVTIQEIERFVVDTRTATESWRKLLKRSAVCSILSFVIAVSFAISQHSPDRNAPYICGGNETFTPNPSCRPSSNGITAREDNSEDVLKANLRSDDFLASSLAERLRDPSLSIDQKIRLLPTFDLSNNDIIALYSEDAERTLLNKLYPGNQFRILINGGSSSAGGGYVNFHETFYFHLANDLEYRFDVVTDVVNRAHGDRNSMHSAMLGEAFFVPSVDLIIWEFSINDQKDGLIDVRNGLILWMRKIMDVYHDEVPLVLLVYLWNKPFSTDQYGRIMADVYDQHALLGAEYDFVLGHVNLAAYLDSLHFSLEELSKNFLADSIHPNALAHATIAKIMTSFTSEKMVPIQRNSSLKSQFEWTCGDDMRDQWQIQGIFEGVLGGMPHAGFTAETPRTSNISLPGILVPYKEYADGSLDLRHQNFATQRYGKVKGDRIDRHRGVTIPCCRHGRLVFNLTQSAPVTAIQFYLHDISGFDGGVLGRRHLSGSDPAQEYDDEVKIAINNQDYSGQVVFSRDWNCLLSHDLFATWIVFEENDRNPMNLSFCTQDKACDSSTPTVEHVILF